MSLVGIRLRYEGEWMSLTEAGDSVGNSSIYIWTRYHWKSILYSGHYTSVMWLVRKAEVSLTATGPESELGSKNSILCIYV
jgi:hypothetical protein